MIIIYSYYSYHAVQYFLQYIGFVWCPCVKKHHVCCCQTGCVVSVCVLIPNS